MLTRLAAVNADLRARMAEPHRHYHTQTHVDSLLALLASHRPAFENPDAVELAIWFHDAVYWPDRQDNERQSATLLQHSLSGLADPDLIARASEMVLATEHHAPPPDLPAGRLRDALLFLDFDMSVLGAAPDVYDRYAEGVRQEFTPVYGDAAYRTGRLAFLSRSLGHRTSLFRTEWGQTLAPAARNNLERERRCLEGSAHPAQPER